VSGSNIDAVKAMYAAFARRDLEGALAFLDPDVEFEPFATSQLAHHVGSYRGHDGARSYFADVAAVWDSFAVHPDDYRAAGDSVVVFGRVVARGSVAEVNSSVIWVWKLRDGRVISGRVFPTEGDALRWIERSGASSA